MSNSDTLTIRLDRALKDRLEGLANETKRTKSSLAAEAIEGFVELEERHLQGVKEAIASIERGRGVAHEDVLTWLASWDSDVTFPLPDASRKSE